MISLSGLSATYPGYEAQEDRTAKTQANQTKAREAAIKLLGANVAGAALAGGQEGPQAPPPGQASVPAPKPMPPAAAPQGAPPPVAPPAPVSPPVAPPPAAAAPQAAAPAGGKLPLQAAIAQILKRTPGVANHPEILLSALTHLNDLGVLDPEAAAKIEETNKQHTAERISTAKGHLQALQGDQPAAPVAPAAPPPPTATNPQTGAKVQWDGKAWQPMS